MEFQIKNIGKVSLTPKGIWNKNKSFERLDFVNVYYQTDSKGNKIFGTETGTLYVTIVAKKDVPLGIEWNNEEFWQEMVVKKAALDDDIKSYIDGEIEDDLRELNNKVSEVDGKTKSNKDSINQLDKTVYNHVQEFNGFKSDYEVELSGIKTTISNNKTAHDNDVRNINTELDKRPTTIIVNDLIKKSKDSLKNEILGGASTAYDTLKELEDALTSDSGVVATLLNKIATLESEIATIKSNYTKSTDFNKVKTTVETLDGLVNGGTNYDGLVTNFTTLEGKVAINTSNISTNTNNISALSSRIDDLDIPSIPNLNNYATTQDLAKVEDKHKADMDKLNTIIHGQADGTDTSKGLVSQVNANNLVLYGDNSSGVELHGIVYKVDKLWENRNNGGSNPGTGNVDLDNYVTKDEFSEIYDKVFDFEHGVEYFDGLWNKIGELNTTVYGNSSGEETPEGLKWKVEHFNGGNNNGEVSGEITVDDFNDVKNKAYIAYVQLNKIQSDITNDTKLKDYSTYADQSISIFGRTHRAYNALFLSEKDSNGNYINYKLNVVNRVIDIENKVGNYSDATNPTITDKIASMDSYLTQVAGGVSNNTSKITDLTSRVYTIDNNNIERDTLITQLNTDRALLNEKVFGNTNGTLTDNGLVKKVEALENNSGGSSSPSVPDGYQIVAVKQETLS